MYYFIKILLNNKFYLLMGIGDWGLGNEDSGSVTEPDLQITINIQHGHNSYKIINTVK